MIGAEQEAHRLAVLRRMAVMDTPPEPAFDQVTQLAAQLFGVQTASVALLDAERLWCKATTDAEMRTAPRSHTLCHYTIARRDEVSVVLDARADPELRELPLVAGAPFVRFYAGAPLVVAGAAVGTLCVFDPAPRARFDPADRARLQALAAPVTEILRLRLESAERRSLARALEFEAGKLSMAEQLAGVGHWSVEDDGAVTWSDQVYRIHGVPRDGFDPALEDAIGFYEPEDRERVTRHVVRARETGEGFAFKARLRRRSDGAVRTVLTKAERRAAADDGDAPAMLFGVFQDVTEEEALLQQVRTDRERYRLLTQNATDVIATYGLDGRFLYVSPSVRRLTGSAPDELVGALASDFVHPDDRARVVEEFRAFLHGEPDSTRIEYRVRSRRGEVRWVEAHPSRLRDGEGEVTGFQDVIRDITGRKRLEAQLEAARDAAEAAARAKSDFLANMSHELRTPLTGILGYAEVLGAEPGLSPPARAHLAQIGEAGRTLLHLVNDVLDFSRMEAQGVQLNARPVRLEALAAAALDLVRPQAEARGLALRLEGPEAAPPVLADPDRLRQVLVNLLANAVKFTPAGEVRLRLAAAPGGGGGRVAVTLAVHDTGVGIAPERLARVFGRFEQADTSIRRRFGGTGLGLAISNTLAEAMGGRLEVESELGRGSTFTLRVDLPPAPADEGDARPTGPAPAAAGLRGARVLLAEDVAMNRDLITLFLQPCGVRLTAVRDGREAVEAAAAERFDVILMDMQMPEVDGLEATRRIRAGGGPNRDTPVVALTANVLPEEIRRCGEAGMTGHLGKPIEAARLQAAVAGALRTGAQAGAAGSKPLVKHAGR